MVSSSPPDEIRVMGHFIGGSTATGLLILVYTLTNDSDLVHYNIITFDKDPEQEVNTDIKFNVTGLIGTHYGISIFATENGLPFPRVVTSPKYLNVDSQGLCVYILMYTSELKVIKGHQM